MTWKQFWIAYRGNNTTITKVDYQASYYYLLLIFEKPLEKSKENMPRHIHSVPGNRPNETKHNSVYSDFDSLF